MLTLKTVVFLFIFIALLTTCLILLFLKYAPVFGGTSDNATQERIKQSPNFNGSVFRNKIKTQASTLKKENFFRKDAQESAFELIKSFVLPPKGKNPQTLQNEPLNVQLKPLQDGEFIWLGHSTVLFRIHGKTIITDPVFYSASPFSCIVSPFKLAHTISPDDLPPLDIVLLSHDHYDHLDYKTIKQITHKVKHFYVPLGVKGHLTRWGVQPNNISEFDWYEDITIDLEHDSAQELTNDTVPHSAEHNKSTTPFLKLTFAPSRHFGGRGLHKNNGTLWGSWILQSHETSLYFSGDGGYSPEFKKIGEQFGGFDIAFIENGAYNVRWKDVHMVPEESAQVAIDIKAKVVLPIHWAQFDLSTHTWLEPVTRIKAAISQHNNSLATHKHITVATPKIGQRFNLLNIPQDEWWI